jgi:hypothetical protein
MKPAALVPMAFVRSVRDSMAFYGKLGFDVVNTHSPEGETEIVWAFLRSGIAQLMLARASDPVDPKAHAVLFYVYVPDVPAFREKVLAAGIEAGPIRNPFYAPRGEFRVTDPDGYRLMIAHT